MSSLARRTLGRGLIWFYCCEPWPHLNVESSRTFVPQETGDFHTDLSQFESVQRYFLPNGASMLNPVWKKCPGSQPLSSGVQSPNWPPPGINKRTEKKEQKLHFFVSQIYKQIMVLEETKIWMFYISQSYALLFLSLFINKFFSPNHENIIKEKK